MNFTFEKMTRVVPSLSYTLNILTGKVSQNDREVVILSRGITSLEFSLDGGNQSDLIITIQIKNINQPKLEVIGRIEDAATHPTLTVGGVTAQMFVEYPNHLGDIENQLGLLSDIEELFLAIYALDNQSPSLEQCHD